MYKYFTNKKERLKIEILQFILFSDKRIFLIDIINKQKISKSSALRYLEELGNDLLITFNSVKLLMTEEGDYIIGKDNKSSNAYVVEEMKEFYIKKSTLFLVFINLFQADPSVKKLASSLNLAHSTIYNNISLLNKIAYSFNTQITLTNTTGLKGDEIGARYFLFFMILTINKTNKKDPFNKMLPASFLQLDNVKQNLITIKELAPSQEMMLRIIQGLTLYCIHNKKQFVELNQDFIDDIQFFNEENFTLVKNKGNFPQSVIENESLFFCFLVRGLIFDIDSYEKKKEIVMLYTASNLEIAQKTNELLLAFSEYASFDYKEKSFIESYYLLLLTLIYFKHINIDSHDLFENKLEIKNYQSTIKTNFKMNEEMITSFLLNNDLSRSLPKYALKELSRILYFVFDINSDSNKIKINVQFTEDIYTGSLIIHSLQSTFSNSTIEITQNPYLADLIIADTFEGKEFKAERFYFNDVYDYEQWNKLLHYITNLIYRKSLFKNIS